MEENQRSQDIHVKAQIEYRRLSELKPNPKNPRKSTKEAVEKLAESIKSNPTFFEARPILLSDRTGELVIIGGERRSEAAKLLGLTFVPTILLHGLDEAAEDEILIKDNTHAGVWDEQKLQSWGKEQLQGWNVEGVKWAKEQPQVKEDDFDPDKKVKTRVKLGDIWQLGNHRLMCGDSTDAGDVALLMDGEKADICFTSPPYNMGGNGDAWARVPNIAMKAGNAYNEYSDNVSDEDYSNLLINSCKNSIEHSDDALFNIGVLSNSRKGIASMLYALRDNFFEIITWKKTVSMPLGMKTQKGMVSHRCEPIFCFNKNGKRRFNHPQWENGCGLNIIETNNASGNKFAKEHAATFPVEFAAEVIKLFTENSVLDLFGGTGTTLIAAEHLNRKCYMMELDPHYCDVIIDRWEQLTGQKAKKIN